MKLISLVCLSFLGCQSLVYHHKISKEVPREQKVYVAGLSGISIAGVDEDSMQHLDTVFVSPGLHTYKVTLTTSSGRGSAVTFKYNAPANSTNIICPIIEDGKKSWRPFVLFNEKDNTMYSLTLCNNYGSMIGNPWKRIETEEPPTKK